MTDDLLTRLQAHALTDGARPAFTFLDDREQEAGCLSFEALWAAAGDVAANLAAFGVRGQRVVLAVADARQFVPLFFGILRAGATAVPLVAPSPRKPAEAFLGLVSHARAVVAVAGGPTAELLGGRVPCLLPEPLLRPVSGSGEAFVDRVPAAFLQYSSGSTGTPKAVVVGHAQIAHNAGAIGRAFGVEPDTVGGGWLPLHHDMGLIGLVLTPVFLGIHSVLMPPMAFLTRPARWLRMVSRYRIAYSGGPNFAFDHCVDRIDAAEREGLDLCAWRVAFNGAEPVRSRTLQRFADTFAQCGFRSRAFFPCYGLAEATLFVAGAPWAGGPDDPVDCGPPAADTIVTIADPETGTVRAPGEVGEVCVTGPGVAAGYFDLPAESEVAFGAGHLRTGDLGFVRDGRLHLAGRLKDLIVVRGRKVHPQDVEHACEVGFAVAFPIDDAEGEQLAVVAEQPRRQDPAALRALVLGMRERVLGRTGLSIAKLAFVAPGALPRTTSGKPRRFLCKQHFLEGRLDTLWAEGNDTVTRGKS